MLERGRFQPLDATDTAILAGRQQAYLHRKNPTPGNFPFAPANGDFVVFADGVVRRISHAHENGSIQTSDLRDTIQSGSFYLGEGYMSFSGGLHGGVPKSSLTLADEFRIGRAWFFHHGEVGADRGVEVTLRCFVWNCNLPAPK